MDAKTLAMIGGIAVALLVTIPLPIYITRKRLKNEWARYEAQQAQGVADDGKEAGDE